MPAGTIGVADFTLFFEGDVSAGRSVFNQPGVYSSRISYRWASVGDNADNVADPRIGDQYSETVDVWPSYNETRGENFRNQPRHHQATFRFGQPFDFTVSIDCEATVWRNTPSSVRAELRCTGWNGFRDVHIRFGPPVTDATITSQSGFNYANPGTTTYAQWASLYQLRAAAMMADTNNNGLTDQMEYALGLNPRALNSGASFLPGAVRIGGQDFASFTYTRPRLWGRPGDLTYLPQYSTNLADWTAAGLVTAVAPSTTQTETVTVRSTQPITTQNREFLCLDVIQP